MVSAQSTAPFPAVNSLHYEKLIDPARHARPISFSQCQELEEFSGVVAEFAEGGGDFFVAS